ncbi:hypothetical protein KUTeg_009897 [Tegillarca granosa]|uniref:Uncharacterized protein n=1 Tax=Tegillarca granosa TaxID=220873 RepID=A0ABQ9F5B6_TEGGR|nr:hypothetical protein KUTeg_009897 [Tegillarca granosa]
MILKGVETSGHVIVSAAKAQILSCTHNPVWRDNQLRILNFGFFQYYATVDPGHDFDDDHMSWLQQENVEDRSEKELSEVSEMVGSGHSAGGVVYSTKGGSKKKAAKDAIQLQRIISRCKCQIFYASYGEVDLDLVPEVPLPPSEDSDVMISKEEGVDTFTLLHHDLNICTNSVSFIMF